MAKFKENGKLKLLIIVGTRPEISQCKDKIRERLERQMLVGETKIDILKHCLTKRL